MNKSAETITNVTAPRTSFKISDITGPYPLLGAFLLIVESLLGFWIFRADSSVERIIAGVLMVLLLGGVLLVVIRLQKQPTSAPEPQGLPGRVTAATELADEKEINAPEPQQIAGPDRSYIINKPPSDWDIQECSITEWVAKGMKIDPLAAEKLFGNMSHAKEILVFCSSHETVVTPVPSRTMTDGNIIPTALQVSIPTQLSIIPLPRYYPPFPVERPFLHDFLKFIGEILKVGVLTLRDLKAGILPNTQRKYLQAEFRQEVKNAIVNEMEGIDINTTLLAIGVEGDLTHHVLMLQYPSLPSGNQPSIDQNLKDLLLLANSFKPITIIDSNESKKKIKEKINNEFKEFLKDHKEELFVQEFSIWTLRYNKSDMENPVKRAEAIRSLKPFKALARELALKDEDLDDLWDALREAEKGNATRFKSIFLKMRNDLQKEVSSQSLKKGQNGKE